MEVSNMPVQATPAPTSVPEQFLHKNRLQEYTQRSAIPLPVYQTHNEGSQHAPQFRATVLVDGATYWSTQTFSNRKAAEQNVARVALEGISKKIMEEGCPMIREDTVFCKSILNEYAVKMNLETPTYVTSQPEGLLPVFISSLVFNGRTYTGGPGRNKREAEQLAARTVILSILGNSDSRTLLSQIIKSKSKLYAALQNVNHTGVSEDINVAYEGNLANSTGTPLSARNEVWTLPATGNVPQLSITACPEALLSRQSQCEFMKPKEVVSWELNSGSEGNVAVAINESLASGLSEPTNATSGLVEESQHVHDNEAKDVVPQVEPSAAKDVVLQVEPSAAKDVVPQVEPSAAKDVVPQVEPTAAKDAVPQVEPSAAIDEMPQLGPSSVSLDAQSIAVNTSIENKRASKSKKKNKSKKARTDEQ